MSCCCCVHKRKRGVEGQKPETKRLRLGSGPAMSNSDGWWRRVVVSHLARSGGGCGHRVRKRKRDEGVEGQKPETKPLRLGSGPAMSNGDGWWCGMVVLCLARSGGGCGHHVRKREWGEGVEGQKPETKRLRLGSGPAVSNDDGGWYTGWWWCISLEVVAVTGIAVTNASGGGGFEDENPKPSARVRFQAASAQLMLKGVAV